MLDMFRSRRMSAWWLAALLPTFAAVLLLAHSPAAVALPVQEEQPPQVEETPQVEEASEVEEAPEAQAVEDTVPADPAAEETAEEEGDTGIAITIEDSDDHDERESRRHRRSVDKDTQIYVGRDLVIREDEVARDAVVFSGSLHIKGKVLGDAVCIFGPITIDGEVTGEVVAVGASVYMGPNAEVMGDVIAIGGVVEREPGARILGEISEVDIGPAIAWPDVPPFWRFNTPYGWDYWHGGAAWNVFWTLFKWVMLIIMTSLIMLIFRQPVERTSRQIRGEFWKSALLGLVAIVFFPFLFAMVVIVLAITIIGIPLLIVVVPLGLMLLLFALLLGYTGAAYSVGQWLGRRFNWSLDNPYLALIVGIVAIQVLSLIAKLLGGLGGYVMFFAMMFWLAGWFVRFAAWTAGFGAALLTQLGRREPAVALPAAASTDTVSATPSPPVAESNAAEGSEPPPAPEVGGDGEEG